VPITNQRKYFGTDGIRGCVGEPPITPDFVMKLGWAAGRILANIGRGPVLIGKDTRVSGYMFESALEAGLSAAGVDIRLLGPMPTPGIAFLAQNTRAQAGIVISASHNPYQDNGIKFFSGDGRKLPDELELAIEKELEQPFKVVNSAKLGKARRMNDAPRRYIEFCKTRIDSAINLSGLKLVVDCAHGATYHIAPHVFEELGASVHAIGIQPDGFNINQETGATSPEKLRQEVMHLGADAGIAFDGDGDRLIMVDHRGEIIDGDEILFIIARANPADLNGAVVGTVMSNLGLEEAVRGLKLDFLRTSVGDRYIMEKLCQDNLVLGGETSGHIIDLRKTTTGDGIISALQVLAAMISSGKKLHELKTGLSKYPQKMINVKVNRRIDPLTLDGIPGLVESVERQLGEHGRILIRTSGTEPVIRVMVEGPDESQVSQIARNLAGEIETAVVKAA
jgi:phosphoglucosamine mutase